ncbi:MAG: hypothetical protein OXT09_26015, partial [Myxococcales bacterium]|nr:hypothetical protein [Myxococcales bacterium]
MAQPPPDLLGRLAVHYGMLTMPQLNAATQQQDRAPNRKIGEILVELGYITESQLAQLLEAQRQYLAQQAGSAAQVLADAQQQSPRSGAALPAAVPGGRPPARPRSGTGPVARARPPTGPVPERG